MALSGVETVLIGGLTECKLYWNITENYSNNTCTINLTCTQQRVNQITPGGTGGQGFNIGVYCYEPSGQYYSPFTGTNNKDNHDNSRFVWTQWTRTSGGNTESSNPYYYVLVDGSLTTYCSNMTRTFNLKNDGTLNIRIGVTNGWPNETEFEASYYQWISKYIDIKISNGHRKINGTWKDGFFWRKINGTWKRCLIWRKINGTWKKGV